MYGENTEVLLWFSLSCVIQIMIAIKNKSACDLTAIYKVYRDLQKKRQIIRNLYIHVVSQSLGKYI